MPRDRKIKKKYSSSDYVLEIIGSEVLNDMDTAFSEDTDTFFYRYMSESFEEDVPDAQIDVPAEEKVKARKKPRKKVKPRGGNSTDKISERKINVS